MQVDAGLKLRAGLTVALQFDNVGINLSVLIA